MSRAATAIAIRAGAKRIKLPTPLAPEPHLSTPAIAPKHFVTTATPVLYQPWCHTNNCNTSFRANCHQRTGARVWIAAAGYLFRREVRGLRPAHPTISHERHLTFTTRYDTLACTRARRLHQPEGRYCARRTNRTMRSRRSDRPCRSGIALRTRITFRAGLAFWSARPWRLITTYKESCRRNRD
jgi:hypothetical protein